MSSSAPNTREHPKGNPELRTSELEAILGIVCHIAKGRAEPIESGTIPEACMQNFVPKSSSQHNAGSTLN